MRMKALLKSLVVLSLLTSFSCSEVTLDPVVCGVPATVRDLTGLDGCGWVFELEDGTKVEPYWPWFCGTPPLPAEMTESPLYNYQYVDGKEVYISYEAVPDVGSSCMTGTIGKITCISDRIVDTGE